MLLSKLFDKPFACELNACAIEANDTREGLLPLSFPCVPVVSGDMTPFPSVREAFAVASSCSLEGLGGPINAPLDILTCEGFALSASRLFSCCKILSKCWAPCA